MTAGQTGQPWLQVRRDSRDCRSDGTAVAAGQTADSDGTAVTAGQTGQPWLQVRRDSDGTAVAAGQTGEPWLQVRRDSGTVRRPACLSNACFNQDWRQSARKKKKKKKKMTASNRFSGESGASRLFMFLSHSSLDHLSPPPLPRSLRPSSTSAPPPPPSVLT